MKIKDLLQLNPEAEILITLQHENGYTTFDLEKCRHIELQDMLKDDKYVEFRCIVHKPKPEKKRRPEDDMEWKEVTSASSWGNYSSLN